MPIRSEALPYALPGAVAAALAAAFGAFWIALGMAVLSAALAAFFRDPERHTDAPARALLSPADGRVVEVTADERGLLIAIFLSVFNVHVTRTPCSGRLREWERIAGGYAMAFRDAASHNARHRLVIDTSAGRIELSLIAGAVARRVVPFFAAPAALSRGERIALIKFGSRAELRLPADHSAVVSVGDRVRAGETIVATAPENP